MERNYRYHERPEREDIDEVYPRIYQSGYGAAENYELIKKLGITHILCVAPFMKPKYPQHFEYCTLDEIEDNSG